MVSTVQPTRWMRDALRQGFALLAANRLNEASDCCRQLLTAKPDLVEAHFLVGLIALELKQTWAAVSAFGSVTKLEPEHGAAWAHMARLFMSAGQPGRADSALENAIRFEDGNPVVHDLIGTVYSMLGEQQDALHWYGKAVERQPSQVAFLVNHANAQMYLGNLAQAEAELRHVLRLQPGNPNAHWILSGVCKVTSSDHVTELETLAAKDGLNPQAAAFLNYAMGKELEDLEEWDEAFEAFARGAAARRLTVEFDEASEVEMYEALARIYTADWLSRQQPGHADGSAIFVVGQPRTGTTLVERIISSHSQVHSAGELRQFGMSIRRLCDYREPKRVSARLVEQAARIDGEKLGNAYLLTTRKVRGDRPRFVDKLPSNFLHIPLILKALPNAKIVHLQRNPMDASFASFKQLFADAYPHSYDQREMARHHARYHRLMALWRERFPGRFFDIPYEDVARDLEPNARELIRYLGLPWEDACLQFHESGGAVTTASAVQVRQPAHTRSIGRWRRYEKQLQPMRDELEACGIDTGLDTGTDTNSA
ncbi:MAG: sulfotransferase [Woeseia sp.]